MVSSWYLRLLPGSEPRHALHVHSENVEGNPLGNLESGLQPAMAHNTSTRAKNVGSAGHKARGKQEQLSRQVQYKTHKLPQRRLHLVFDCVVYISSSAVRSKWRRQVEWDPCRIKSFFRGLSLVTIKNAVIGNMLGRKSNDIWRLMVRVHFLFSVSSFSSFQ